MDYREIISIVREHYPRVLGIYVFGTFGAAKERPDSDLDLALLLHPEEAKRENSLAFSVCRNVLESRTGRSVDLINLMETNTVFQNEIITEGKLVYCLDPEETDAFEMQVLSAYQKLNEERAAILNDIMTSGRVLQ
jgi:predicted nucleotidyltransferase